MERLTWKTVAGTVNFSMDNKIRKDNIARSAFYQLVAERLAAYEDTGLSPDEIPRWIDAESEMPEIGQRVLLYLPDKEDDIRAGKYLGDGDYRIGMKVYRGYEIGAWQPLPAAPKEEKRCECI